jgi:putative solute:sodium symporter small subunit
LNPGLSIYTPPAWRDCLREVLGEEGVLAHASQTVQPAFFIYVWRSTMQLTDKHREYWNRNLRLTAFLLGIWFVATFVVIYFARELNDIVIMGFPFAFYMGAQGSLIIYVLVIWYYARRMNQLDQEYGVHEGDD